MDTYRNYISDSIPGWQHQYMADYYVNYIAEGLKELHPYLTSQKFVNFCESGTFAMNGSGEFFEWNWDDFFQALAWTGLRSLLGNDSYVVPAWEALSEREKDLMLTFQGLNYESNDCVN